MRKHFLRHWGAYIGSLCLIALLAVGYVFHKEPPAKTLPGPLLCENLVRIGCDCVGSCYCQSGGRCCEACRD